MGSLFPFETFDEQLWCAPCSSPLLCFVHQHPLLCPFTDTRQRDKKRKKEEEKSTYFFGCVLQLHQTRLPEDFVTEARETGLRKEEVAAVGLV